MGRRTHRWFADGVEYRTLSDIAKYYNIPKSTIQKWYRDIENPNTSCPFMREKISLPSISTGDNFKIARILHGMIQRCYYEKAINYHNYGGRGITICDEWRYDTHNFVAWCRANGWKSGLQIERDDNDGNYCPENCYFVTPRIQSQGTRQSKRWYVNGVCYNSLSHAAEMLNVTTQKIKRWCDGYTTPKGTYFPPKPNCWSVLKYPK